MAVRNVKGVNTKSVACLACGVVIPWHFKRCPYCGCRIWRMRWGGQHDKRRYILYTGMLILLMLVNQWLMH
ncbi:hypothetical protein [Citrobacter amalonaticus]|uniref:hypothetical protein n=1 Tax=Citrobacter amalonaticus TaxID=35703 RepID=UPI0011AF5F6A|nr:hypothetical protein [Citrobacter amalonaticus]